MKPRLAVLDLETDPFEHNTIVQPFVAGFYDGSKFQSIWSTDCVSRTAAAITRDYPEPLVIYAHNGGKFDWLYFLPHLHADLRIVHGRIIYARMAHHEVRDSYAILPFPLAAYDKDEIDYNLMRKDKRETHRDEIIKYLRKDCVSLYELVSAFHEQFGDSLTVGSASMKQIKARHSFRAGGKQFDTKFREAFYFGGRNQCFKSGVIHQPCNIYDVNSQYPEAMRSFLHPVDSATMTVSKWIEPNTCFLVVEGKNDGAFPVRTDIGLDFTVPLGRFATTIHEYNAALATGSFRPTKLIKTYGCATRITFDDFVNDYYNFKVAAKLADDKIRELLFKYILNSGYGKFAQNPANFREYTITLDCQDRPSDEWILYSMHLELSPAVFIWSRPSPRQTYFNVTTGASITGAARSILLRGLRASVDPLYCDTDSIIARDLRGDGIVLNDTELGGWKYEGGGNMIAIAGKKLYAVFDTTKPDQRQCLHTPCKTCKDHGCDCIKKAHRGGRLTGNEILRIAQGEQIKYHVAAPHWRYAEPGCRICGNNQSECTCTQFRPIPNIKSGWQFVKRTIKRTAFM